MASICVEYVIVWITRKGSRIDDMWVCSSSGPSTRKVMNVTSASTIRQSAHIGFTMLSRRCWRARALIARYDATYA